MSDEIPEWTVDNVKDAGPWQEFYKIASTRMRRMDGPFRVLTSEGPVTCEDGWLALDSRGYPYPIAADEQAAIYGAATEVEQERLRTLFTERVAAQYVARRASEAVLALRNLIDENIAELTPLLITAMSAHPDPASTQARASIEQIERLANFFLTEHPELISGDRSPVDVAIDAITTMTVTTAETNTPVLEMLRAVRDNLVIHSTRSGRVGWRLPHEALRQHRFHHLAQDEAKPWSDREREALHDALNADLIAIDHTQVLLTNRGRAALGLVALDGRDPDPINSGLAEPGKLG